MLELAPLIYDLTIMLGVAAFVVLVFQRIHQPIVLGYLVAGMLIGPYTPPYSLITEMKDIHTLSELGVIFLMFSLGLEFSFHKLVRVGFPALVTGSIEVIFMLMVGYATGRLLGWSFYDSLFLGAALSISSTTIIIKAIDELKLKTKQFAELIFGVLIVEDLLAIILLVGLSTVVMTQDIFSSDMLFAATKLILVVGAWFMIGYFIVPTLFRQIARYVSEETLTIVSVALCLFLVAVAAKFQYSTALGAFIMGSILAETVLNHRIEILMRPIRDIFAAVFFISIGMLINPAVILQQWQAVLLITLVTVVGKVIATTVGPFLAGKPIGTSVRVGFGMAQIGEFSFIIVGLGVALGVTGNTLYPIIVAVSSITTFTTPYMIKLSGRISDHIEHNAPPKIKYFLMNYSLWAQRAVASSSQQPWFRRISVRLFMNGMIVAIIFTVVHSLLFPILLEVSDSITAANLFGLVTATILSLPFIWGMLFAWRLSSVPSFTSNRINPSVTLIWLVTLSEIGFLGVIYFQSWITIAILIGIGSLLFLIFFRHLEKSYHWFESRLLENIQMKDESVSRYGELAPWDTHLVELEIGHQSICAGKTLAELQVRQLYGVNIVAICHGERVIPMPRGKERILPTDKLIVLGSDEQIDNFRRQVESISDQPLQTSFLDNFMIKSFLLSADSPFTGKSIRENRLRELINGQIVGLERDNERVLSPEPDTVLKAGDLVFLVGEADKIESLAV